MFGKKKRIVKTCVHVYEVASVMSSSFAAPWTVAHQAPLSMGVSRQEYWSGLPFLRPGDLPNPGIKYTSLMSPALVGMFLTIVPPGKIPVITHLIKHLLYVCEAYAVMSADFPRPRADFSASSPLKWALSPIFTAPPQGSAWKHIHCHK